MSDWIIPEFANGWTAWPENPMRYRKEPDGGATIIGVAIPGDRTKAIFYFPADVDLSNKGSFNDFVQPWLGPWPGHGYANRWRIKDDRGLYLIDQFDF